jgi:hypothetical protein
MLLPTTLSCILIISLILCSTPVKASASGDFAAMDVVVLNRLINVSQNYIFSLSAPGATVDSTTYW